MRRDGTHWIDERIDGRDGSDGSKDAIRRERGPWRVPSHMFVVWALPSPPRHSIDIALSPYAPLYYNHNVVAANSALISH